MAKHKTIEDNMKEVLGGELLKNALDFVVYMKENGMTVSGNRFYYKGELTCIPIWKKDVNNPDGEWILCHCPINEHKGFPLDESVKEYVQASVSKCRNCGCDHEERGATKMIFGKEFDNLCSSEIAFINPDAAAVEKIKILMELWKYKLDNIISDSKTF